MSQYETVFKYSRELETLLEQHWGASGQGLHSKVTSVQHRLPAAVIRKLRFVATVRNHLAHEAGFKVNNLAAFSAKAEQALAYLKGEPERPTGVVSALTGRVAAFGAALGRHTGWRYLGRELCVMLPLSRSGWPLLAGGLGSAFLLDMPVQNYVDSGHALGDNWLSASLTLGVMVLSVYLLAWAWQASASRRR